MHQWGTATFHPSKYLTNDYETSVVYKVIITGFVSNVYFCHDASIFVDVSTFVNDVITTEMNRKVIDSLIVIKGVYEESIGK